MIRVLVVDDEKLARDGLRAFLAREKDILIVAEAHDGREAVELTCDLAPDVILMDIKMPVLDGLQATKNICGRESNAKILILSASYDDALLRLALANGAHGYVAKHEGYLELGKAVRTVHEGKAYFSPSIAKLLPPAS
jgi:DNA-binding NarL/FixJ family response regulator